MTLDPQRGLRARYERFLRWLLLEGNRLLITGGVAAGFFALTWTLATNGVIAVGPRSGLQSVLGSGVVAGLFSLISLTLTINQLISSRVFGTLNTFQEKLESGTDLRDTVADIAGHPSPPVDTAAFISFIGETLHEQADALHDEHDHGDGEFDDRISSYAASLDDYAEQIQRVSPEMPPETVVARLTGPDFALQFDRTDHLRNRHDDRLTVAERERLDQVTDLLGAVAIFRQYFKTISLHQELARLSRQFVFIGFPAMVVTLLSPLLYRTNPAEVLVPYPLPLVMSLVLTVAVTPLVLLMAYVLRVSTIFRYTVSVAPFTPPVKWQWSDHRD